MEDWNADFSPCNFATTHFPQKGALLFPVIFGHPFDSLHSEVLSTLNFATHEMEDSFAMLAIFKLFIRNFPEPPTTAIVSKVLPVQMGGVLRYK